jgi:broad specificity phosphatase PhoE
MAGTATRLLLVRHGQSTWNADGRWQGHADPPLSPLGMAQAREAAEACPPVDAVVASDLLRARQTAEVIARSRDFGPVAADRRLRETDSGEWTGLTRAQIDRAWPGWLAEERRPPNFEGWDEVAARVAAALADIHAARPGGRVLVVVHGGVIRALERSINAAGSLPKNLGGRWFEVDSGGIMAGDAVSLIDHGDVVVTAPDTL